MTTADEQEHLWRAGDIARVCSGRLEGAAESLPVNGISIDSRTIAAGDAFFAIRGDRLDGHEFAGAALKSAASIAVISKNVRSIAACGPVILVDDVLKALEALGCEARRRMRGQVIAVTGSVGKTSTKYALATMLSACGRTHASSASYNNHWGVPLSLSRMPGDTEYGIFEIGMSHAGEITPLVQMVKPHIAVITRIAESHLGHFATLDEIADAKAEIFSGVAEAGAAVLNRDDRYFERLAGAAESAGVKRILTFGKHKKADVRASHLLLKENCSCIEADVAGAPVVFKLGSPGEHMAMNALAGLAAATLAGADIAKATLALASFRPTAGRGQRHRLGRAGEEITLLDESYNANPASMRAALALLGSASVGRGGRRIAVLGDMLELGENAQGLHAGLAEAIDACGADAVYACGEAMRHLWNVLPGSKRGAWTPSSQELAPLVLQAIRAGDAVMVKGSLGSRMRPIADAIVARFGLREDRQAS